MVHHLFFYGGMADPTVINGIAKMQLPQQNIFLENYDLRHQPLDRAPELVQKILQSSWGDEHIGGFSIVPAKHKVVPGILCQVDGKHYGEVMGRFASFNLHGDWYRKAVIESVDEEGRIIKIETEVLIADPKDLELVPEGLLESEKFTKYIQRMREIAQGENSITEERQHSASKER